MIYINGHRASRADLARLLADLKSGTQSTTARTTKGGAYIYIITPGGKKQRLFLE